MVFMTENNITGVQSLYKPFGFCFGANAISQEEQKLEDKSQLEDNYIYNALKVMSYFRSYNLAAFSLLVDSLHSIGYLLGEDIPTSTRISYTVGFLFRSILEGAILFSSRSVAPYLFALDAAYTVYHYFPEIKEGVKTFFSPVEIF